MIDVLCRATLNHLRPQESLSSFDDSYIYTSLCKPETESYSTLVLHMKQYQEYNT